MTKPILLFDGDCKFCRFWARRGQIKTGERVTWASYQRVRDKFPNIALAEFQSSVKFVDEEGMVYSGAEALFRCLAVGKAFCLPLWLYKNLPGFSNVTEFVYRIIAGHRSFFSKFNRFFS